MPEKLVVSYAAIVAAHGEFVQARSTVDAVIGSLKDVGSETQHAKKLDHALSEYARRLRAVRAELDEKLGALATFLATAERYYRYVDETALTRAVPYDPHHPSPTLVVSPYGTGVDTLPPGVPDAGAVVGPVVGPRGHQVTGTTVLGVPAGANGAGTDVHGKAAVPHPTPPEPVIVTTNGPVGNGVDLGGYSDPTAFPGLTSTVGP